MKARTALTLAGLAVLLSACTTTSPTSADDVEAPSYEEARGSGGMGSGH